MEANVTQRRSAILSYHCYSKPNIEVISISSTETEPTKFKNSVQPHRQVYSRKPILPPHLVRQLALGPSKDFELPEPEFSQLKQLKAKQDSESSSSSSSKYVQTPITSGPKPPNQTQLESKDKVALWNANFEEAYRNEYEDCEKESYEVLRDQVMYKKSLYQSDLKAKFTKPRVNGKCSSPVVKSKREEITQLTPLSPETTKRNEFYSYLQIGVKPMVNSNGNMIEPNRRSVRVRNLNFNKERDRSISEEFRLDIRNGHTKNKPPVDKKRDKRKQISILDKIRKKLSPMIVSNQLNQTRAKRKYNIRKLRQRKKLKPVFKIQKRKPRKPSSDSDEQIENTPKTKSNQLTKLHRKHPKTDSSEEQSELGFSKLDKAKSIKSGELLKLVTEKMNASITSLTLPKLKIQRKMLRSNGVRRGRPRIPLNNNVIQRKKAKEITTHELFENLKTEFSVTQKHIIELTANYSFSDSLSESGESQDSFHGFGPEPSYLPSNCDSTSVSYSEITAVPERLPETIKCMPMSPQTIKAFNAKKSPKIQACEFGSEAPWPLFESTNTPTPRLRQIICRKLSNKSAPSKIKEQYSIDIDKADGEVSSVHFVRSTLIIAQELVISFWDQTPLGTMLGSQNMWMSKGKLERLKLELGCLSVATRSETCFCSDNFIAYIEIWGKEHKSEKRERPITDIFATVYFHQRKGNVLEKKVIQLENIIGFTEDVTYTILQQNRTIIVSWRDQFASPSQVSQIRKYQLAMDFQTVSNVCELQYVDHYISSLHNVKDCSEMVLGMGDFNVSIWLVPQGQLITTVTIDPPRVGASLSLSPGRDYDINCLWASCDRGYLFLINKTESNNCLNLIAISGLHSNWKNLQVYRIPPEYAGISSVSVEGGILSATSEKGIVCWSMQTGTILLECPAGKNIKLFASDKYISLIDECFNVTLKNLFAFLLED